MSRNLVAFVCALTAASCSSGESNTPAPSAAVDAGDEDTLVADAAPEPEVCGHAVGDTFCDSELMGYVRTSETTGLASSTEYGAHKISAVLAAGAQKYAYVYASAYW